MTGAFGTAGAEAATTGGGVETGFGTGGAAGGGVAGFAVGTGAGALGFAGVGAGAGTGTDRSSSQIAAHTPQVWILLVDALHAWGPQFGQ